jgi:hypothetical protein
MNAQLDFFEIHPAPRNFGANFDGATFEPKRDAQRLVSQLESVFNLMRDGQWRSLDRIQFATGHPQASISARLRDLRKDVHGGHDVERRHVGGGLFEYRLIENEGH